MEPFRIQQEETGGRGILRLLGGTVPEERETPRTFGPQQPIQQQTGDWSCAACGDHQFARNTHCRRCGNPKPSPTQVGAGFAPLHQTQGGPGHQPSQAGGDWNCPACGDLQFARNVACRKCGGPRPNASTAPSSNVPTTTATPYQQGPSHSSQATAAVSSDWNCASCGDLQFARNVACRKCGSPRPSATSSSSSLSSVPSTRVSIPDQQGPTGASAPDRKAVLMDWDCTSCGDLQFARNVACRKCGSPRPAPSTTEMTTAASISQQQPPSDASMRDRKPVDWNCASCGDLQFARNVACRKCGAPRASVLTPLPQHQHQNAAPSPRDSTSQAPTPAEPKPTVKQDWTCQGCGDFQFARNDKCRKCGALRPNGTASGTQAPAGGPLSAPSAAHVSQPDSKQPPSGDWHCSACHDLQFGRNTKCRRCGTPRNPGGWTCVVCEANQPTTAQQCDACGMNRPTPEALRIYQERKAAQQSSSNERQTTIRATRSYRSYDDDIDPVAEMRDAYDAYYYGS